jgi:hypothetical protein
MTRILAIFLALLSFCAGEDLRGREETDARQKEESARRLQASRERGKAFEEDVRKKLDDSPNGKRFDDQVRVKSAYSGKESVPDFVVRRSDGALTAVEAKSGASARLTGNQEALRKEGGLVVSSGKPEIKAGEEIKPNRVAIVRDQNGNDAQAKKQAPREDRNK